MFKSARIKLTIWYLLIIMLVSVFFSALIYHSVSSELERGFRRAELRYRAEELGIPLPQRFSLKPEELRPELRELAPRFLLVEDWEEACKTLRVRLLLINGVILVVSAAVSYYLAGRTLAPLEKAMEEQKRFVADASHEFRTPLTALKTSMEVALREKRLALSDARRVLKEGLEDIDQLSNLSGKLLLLSRLQKGADLAFKKVNFDELIKKLVKKMEPTAKKKDVKIETDLQSLQIEADEERLKEMILIFLDNAIKFTPKKGKISISLTKDAKFVISDRGIGISQEHLPHIFDRFYRVDSARAKTKTDGFGLGLSLAKQIIKAHKGSIKVRSQVDKGTTFSIKLPIKHS
jgi:two-component system sensor histidine kinase CiaH